MLQGAACLLAGQSAGCLLVFPAGGACCWRPYLWAWLHRAAPIHSVTPSLHCDLD